MKNSAIWENCIVLWWFYEIYTTLYLGRCLPEIFCAKQMVLENVIRTYWVMQKSKKQNHIMCPLRGLVQHRPKNPPNLGRMGCLCQLLSPKGHMIWFLFFHYMFPVAKWVRKYPPCALHKTFLVRCLRKYSVRLFCLLQYNASNKKS